MPIKPDDDIYIDCKPVNMINADEDDNGSGSTNPNANAKTNPMSLISTQLMAPSAMDNVGLQTVIGIAAIAVIYSLGNYVFKSFPKSLITERMNE